MFQKGSIHLAPYPKFGTWPVEILSISGQNVTVAFFPDLTEKMVVQKDELRDLPNKAPRSWKSGKKEAFKKAKAKALGTQAPFPSTERGQADTEPEARTSRAKRQKAPLPSPEHQGQVDTEGTSQAKKRRPSPDHRLQADTEAGTSQAKRQKKAKALGTQPPLPSTERGQADTEPEDRTSRTKRQKAPLPSPEPRGQADTEAARQTKRQKAPLPSPEHQGQADTEGTSQADMEGTSQAKRQRSPDHRVQADTEVPLPRPDHRGQADTEAGTSKGKKTTHNRLSLEFFVEKLPKKFEEGNKKRGAKEQERTDAGTFGSKDFWDCSWRTWLKTMYSCHPNVVCFCTCNDHPLASAQSLIKHIERNHYVNKTVLLENYQICITEISG